MFKTKKTRQLEQAMDLVNQVTTKFAETIQSLERAMQLARENGELRDRAIQNAETWQRWYEEEIAKNKPLAFTRELEERLDAAFLKACGIASIGTL